MALKAYERTAYRMFRHAARTSIKAMPRLPRALERARIDVRPEVYLAKTYLSMLIAFGASFGILVLVLAVGLGGFLPGGGTSVLLLVPLPLAAPMIVYIASLVTPDMRAGSRAKRMDAHLPYALSYISILTAAGVPPARVFTSVAAQPVYGEIAKECGVIARDMNVFGKDLRKALSDGMDRTPSLKLQNVLQGAVTALTSGVDIKQYFLAKAEQLFYDNRQEQRRFLDSLGVLAEAFVTVVVAGPTFMLVLLSIMAVVGASASGSLALGYVLILGLLPLAQLGFAFAVLAMSAEV